MIPAFDIYQPKPISAYNKTEMVFDENTIRKGRVDMNPKAVAYFHEEVNKRFYDNSDVMYLKYKFLELFEKWNDETAFSSSASEIIGNENFRQIVSYGERMIPVILTEIKRQPSNIVWALNLITGHNISDRPISIEDACKLWVKWGKDSKVLA